MIVYISGENETLVYPQFVKHVSSLNALTRESVAEHFLLQKIKPLIEPV